MTLGRAPGAVIISADAFDNVGVTGVQIKLDGAALGPDLVNAPYSVTWSTTGATNGCHVLTAVARDAAGNVGSTELLVTVNNP